MHACSTYLSHIDKSDDILLSSITIDPPIVLATLKTGKSLQLKSINLNNLNHSKLHESI